MDLSLKDRVAFVAGSSRGIGRAIAAELLAEGCNVCVSGRDAASLDAACAEFEKRFGAERILKLCVDLTDPSVVKESVATLVECWGALHILVANLGSGKGTPGWSVDQGEWNRLFDVNLRASVWLAQAAIPAIGDAGGGSIVFISSICGIEATPAPLAYSAAKAALDNYSKNLSRAVADQKIRVNCVAPGNILFPGGTWEKHLEQRREQVMNMIETQVPLRRFGDPAEIAALVAFLCSDRAAFITGSCYVADGGQTRTI
jgi:3-oxoacyl-[acyl-carrier protein] reductase